VDREHKSVCDQTRLKIRPTHNWQVKPGRGPIPINPWDSPGLARPVHSNIRYRLLHFILIVTFMDVTVDRNILTLVSHSPFAMYRLPQWSKRIDTCALPHPNNERKQNVNDCGLCILGNLGVWLVEFSHTPAKLSPLYFENELRRRINDVGSCIVCNTSGVWSQAFINNVMAAVMGR
jgi:hypothetical protein